MSETSRTEPNADDEAPDTLAPTLAQGPVPSPASARTGAVLFGPPAHAGDLGTFGRYRVLKKLGQGGMGAVYLGYDARGRRGHVR